MVKGWHHSEEAKERIRFAKLGNKNPMKKKENQEKVRDTIQRLYDEKKLIAGMTGKNQSEQAKLKLSIAHKGKPKLYLKGIPKSIEHRKKLSDTRKKLFSEGKIKHNILEYNKCHKREKHPRWLGGMSFEPYTPIFNKEFKNLIRLRDNFCCINCGVSEQKSIIIERRKLSIHHIDYDKKNTCLQNCCSLCNKCNLMANLNRNVWIDYFQSLLSNKYNYSYPCVQRNIQMEK